MGCEPDAPENCECMRIGTPLLDKFQDVKEWCTYEEGFENRCCYSIKNTWSSLGLTYEEYNCKLPNMTVVNQKPELCAIPCSNSFPENCECFAPEIPSSVKDIHEWCTLDRPECCYSQAMDGIPVDGSTVANRKCQVLNQTMSQLYPAICTSIYELNWRSPITNGAKCFTSVSSSTGVSTLKQNQSLGDGFICMNYFSWHEPLSKYVAIATSGDEDLFASMSLYPNTYMMLQKCSVDYCNDANLFEQAHNQSFTPDMSGQTGPGLDCMKGVYPDVNSAFVYNADVCIRYSFKPNFDSDVVTVYDGLPSSLFLQLQNASFVQDVTSCSNSNCNSVINPTASGDSNYDFSPNDSKNLTCFRNIDSDGVIVAHPNPSVDPRTRYCISVVSALDNQKMFFPARNYEAFTAYSKTANITVCNTSFCNTPGNSEGNLSCYLTDTGNQTNHIRSDLALPVDYCVKYQTSSDIQIYSGVTSDQLAILNANPLKFKNVESCQTDFCLVP